MNNPALERELKATRSRTRDSKPPAPEETIPDERSERKRKGSTDPSEDPEPKRNQRPTIQVTDPPPRENIATEPKTRRVKGYLAKRSPLRKKKPKKAGHMTHNEIMEAENFKRREERFREEAREMLRDLGNEEEATEKEPSRPIPKDKSKITVDEEIAAQMEADERLGASQESENEGASQDERSRGRSDGEGQSSESQVASPIWTQDSKDGDSGLLDSDNDSKASYWGETLSEQEEKIARDKLAVKRAKEDLARREAALKEDKVKWEKDKTERRHREPCDAEETRAAADGGNPPAEKPPSVKQAPRAGLGSSDSSDSSTDGRGIGSDGWTTVVSTLSQSDHRIRLKELQEPTTTCAKEWKNIVELCKDKDLKDSTPWNKKLEAIATLFIQKGKIEWPENVTRLFNGFTHGDRDRLQMALNYLKNPGIIVDLNNPRIHHGDCGRLLLNRVINQGREDKRTEQYDMSKLLVEGCLYLLKRIGDFNPEAQNAVQQSATLGSATEKLTQKPLIDFIETNERNRRTVVTQLRKVMDETVPKQEKETREFVLGNFSRLIEKKVLQEEDFERKRREDPDHNEKQPSGSNSKDDPITFLREAIQEFAQLGNDSVNIRAKFMGPSTAQKPNRQDHSNDRNNDRDRDHDRRDRYRERDERKPRGNDRSRERERDRNRDDRHHVERRDRNGDRHRDDRKSANGSTSSRNTGSTSSRTGTLHLHFLGVISPLLLWGEITPERSPPNGVISPQ